MENIIEKAIRHFKSTNWLEPSSIEDLQEGIKLSGDKLSIDKENNTWIITEYISNKQIVMDISNIQRMFEEIKNKSLINNIAIKSKFKSGRELIEDCLNEERGNFRRIDFLIKKFSGKVNSLKEFLFLVRREVINGFMLKAEQSVNGKYVYFFTEDNSTNNEGVFISSNDPSIADIVIKKENLISKLGLIK